LKRKIREFISQGRNKFYLREIVEEAHVSMRDAEDFFIPILEENKIEGSLELRCPNCGADQGAFKKYHEIPPEIECEICSYKFSRSGEYVNIILEVKGKFFRAQKISPASHRQKTQQIGNEQLVEGCNRGTERCSERREIRVFL